MLEAYDAYLVTLRSIRGEIARIEHRDIDLARQLRRAAASVALNMAEGSGSQGGTRRQRYLSSLGSANEVLACFDVASALGYCDPPPNLRRSLQRTIATLVCLTGLRTT
ncbi:MAG: four helix bundle protein [Polyangiaceae bacterium]